MTSSAFIAAIQCSPPTGDRPADDKLSRRGTSNIQKQIWRYVWAVYVAPRLLLHWVYKILVPMAATFCWAARM